MLDPVQLLSEEQIQITLSAKTKKFDSPFKKASSIAEKDETPRAEKIKKEGLRLLDEL